MTGSGTYASLESEALERHGQIHFYLDRLERSVDELEPDSGDGEQLSRLVAEIEIFKERMAEHNREENENLYRSLAAALPMEGEAITGLAQQHHRILEVLEMAVLHARDCDERGLADLRVDLKRFLAEIREHEKAEEALLEQAVGR